MKLAKFVYYGGSEMPRLFLHHAEWAINEVRTVTEQEAKDLEDKFSGCFEFSDPAPPTPPVEPEPAEQPASDQPVDPAKE